MVDKKAEVMVSVDVLSETPQINVVLPVGHPLADSLLTIPGFHWDPKYRIYVADLTRRTALKLREQLTGWRPSLDETTKQLLSSTANSQPQPDIVVVKRKEEKFFSVSFEHSKERQEDIKRYCKGKWDASTGSWIVAETFYKELENFASKHELLFDDVSKKLIKSQQKPFIFDGSIEGLKGVPLTDLATVRNTPKRGKTPSLEDRLKSFGIHNISDLMNHIPYRYLNRSSQVPLSKAKIGEDFGFIGKVLSVEPNRAKRMVRFTVSDGSAKVSLTYFNAWWMENKFKPGDEVAVHGRLDLWKPKGSISGGKLQMNNPLMDLIGTEKSLIVPVYMQSEKSKITSRELYQCAAEAVDKISNLIDPLPDDMRSRLNLTERSLAYVNAHKPDSMEQAELARHRLAFDELFRMQLALGMRRGANEEEVGVQHNITGKLVDQVTGKLPFDLTGAQKNALKEIREDLLRPHPMHRLLQGDVGSGKAQPLYSKVLTVNGWETMGDMKVGTIIITPEGKTAKVGGVYPQGVRPVYKVTLDDGSTTDCDINHLWKIAFTPSDNEEDYVIKPLTEMFDLFDSGTQMFLPKISRIVSAQKSGKHRKIVDITKVGELPTQCIYVEDDKHMYITDDYIPTHNTLVSICSLMMGIEGGYQGALMAPTEILAQQLYVETLERTEGILINGEPIVVEFLGGKTRVKERRRILEGLEDGSVHILVGTHALITDAVIFKNLGIVVIDEQHRFGVEQRAMLKSKGVNGAPDVLVMTATPIPRTAALTVYGDLDISILNELPPGRTPIKTSWLNMPVILEGDKHNPGAPWSQIREEVAKGRQAYVVASLVEDNETLAAASAEETFAALQAGPLEGLRIGMVHGKQKRDIREETMKNFKDGNLDVLVATTVIEVGVNVPNATVMVVLDASRFGIAQLHQIRGRVGRGKHASSCILVGQPTSSDGVIRMKALCESTDGFYLSEVDLNLRGEGTLFSTSQSGLSDLKVANLKRDVELISLAKNEAKNLMVNDHQLLRRPQLRNEVLSMLGDEAAEWLSKS